MGLYQRNGKHTTHIPVIHNLQGKVSFTVEDVAGLLQALVPSSDKEKDGEGLSDDTKKEKLGLNAPLKTAGQPEKVRSPSLQKLSAYIFSNRLLMIEII